MSFKLICDRCENFCPNGEDQIIKAYEISSITLYKDNTQSLSKKEYHLCEKCYKDFMSFITD